MRRSTPVRDHPAEHHALSRAARPIQGSRGERRHPRSGRGTRQPLRQAPAAGVRKASAAPSPSVRGRKRQTRGRRRSAFPPSSARAMPLPRQASKTVTRSVPDLEADPLRRQAIRGTSRRIPTASSPRSPCRLPPGRARLPSAPCTQRRTGPACARRASRSRPRRAWWAQAGAIRASHTGD